MHSQNILITDAFAKQLSMMGIGLVGASLVYLIAANWFMIPDGIQLVIAPALMVLFMVAGFFGKSFLQNSLYTLSATMIGLSLAVIGQVYQTGADSSWLFAIWSVLLLLWLTQKNMGIFALFGVVSNVALYLFFAQHDFALDYYFVLASLLGLSQFFVAKKHYPILSYGFVVFFGGISTLSALRLNEVSSHGAQLMNIITLLLAPVIAIFTAKKQQNTVLSSLAIALLASSLFVLFVTYGDSELSLWASGVLALFWFGVVGFLVSRMFPASKVHTIPLALGGWIAGLLMSLFILVDVESLVWVIGVIFWVMGVVLLKKCYKHIFVRHLGYVLFAIGQVALHYALQDKFYANDSAVFYVHILPHLLFLAVVVWLRVHWLYVAAQALVLYFFVAQTLRWDLGLAQYAMNNEIAMHSWGDTLAFLLGVLPIFLLNYQPAHQKFREYLEHYKKSIAVFLLVVLVAWAGYHQFELYQDGHKILSHHIANVPLVVSGLAVVVGLLYQLGLKNIAQHRWLFGYLVLGVVLVFLGHVDVFLLFILLAYAMSKKDTLLHTLTVIALVALLWQLYYVLSVPFLVKFVSIFLSGVFVLALGRIIQHKSEALV